MIFKHRRALLLTDVPVNGYYRFSDDFQILQSDDEAPKPPYIMAHHPLIIEFKYKTDESKRYFPDGREIPQWSNDNDEANKRLYEIMLLVSACSFYRIFYYSNSQSWFVPMSGEKEKSLKVQWGQKAYFYNGFNLEIESLTKAKLPEITKIESNKYFNQFGRHLDQEFELPNNLDALISKYNTLNQDSKDTFLTSASLLNQGIKLWSQHPSLSFAALVSSIETLIANDYKYIKIERCRECGQERYRVVKKFVEFFEKYGLQTPEYKKYATKIYKFRSKILHRGSLFIGEVSPRRFWDIDGMEEDNLRRSIIRTCRIGLINWLILHPSDE